MADYIKSNILSQSYVHVEPEWLNSVSDSEKRKAIVEIHNKVSSFSEERIRFFLDDDVHIEIKFEDGSIRAWVTTYGPVLLLIGSTITNYSSFRKVSSTWFLTLRELQILLMRKCFFSQNQEVRKRFCELNHARVSLAL